MAFAAALALPIHSAIGFNLQISANAATFGVNLGDTKHSPMAEPCADGQADIVSQPEKYVPEATRPDHDHVACRLKIQTCSQLLPNNIALMKYMAEVGISD